MKEGETVVDVLIVLEGQNPSFYSYMSHDEALSIQENGGLSCAEKVNLRETPDRKVSEALKKGETCIEDVLVRLEPCRDYWLN